MTPLLGSLARLIARGTAISNEQLELLLTAADLEANPDALHELQRWARLLQSLYDSPGEALRHTVVEGLMLRGLPEAPVLLAVSTVAEQARATLPTPSSLQTGGLSVSVSSLDLGTLRPGQAASGEFEVQGGSGHIVVESDQLEPVMNFAN